MQAWASSRLPRCQLQSAAMKSRRALPASQLKVRFVLLSQHGLSYDDSCCSA